MADLMQRIERGKMARELLDHPMLAAAFEGVEAGVFEAWKGATDPVSRETLWAGFHGARRVQVWLEAIADDGMMAEADAKRAETE